MQFIKRSFRPEQIRELSLIVLIALIIMFFSSQIEGYFSPRIFNRVTSDVAIIAVVALGETLVLLTRNYDLSVASVVGLTAFFIGKQLTAYPDLNPMLAMLLAISAGAGLGLINGLLVSYGRIPSIIVTLGTLAIYRAALVAYPGNKIVVINDLPEWITKLGSTQLFSIGEFDIRPVVAGGLLMFIIFQLVTSYTRFGRRLYAIGSNPEAARIGGLPSQRIVLSSYILCGAIAGLAGFLYLVRYGNLNTAAASGMELKAIAAAVVGGVSTNGGKGTVMGALLGAIMINLLQQSLLRWLVISDFWVDALLGLLILLAVLIDSVIMNRLGVLWRGRDLNPVDEKIIEEKKSHAA
ncbi:MAG TPA: ABC transporter permease [Anaerolineales bacterium]|nr:ABC transporter permease [Anaerolineales bacterium]